METFYRGSKLTIYFVTQGDTCPAAEYFAQLPSDVLVAFASIAKKLADHGHVYNTEQFRKVGDHFFEIKPKGHRFLGFFHAGAFFVTHGFKKRGGGKKEKFPQKEIEKALPIYNQLKQNKN